MRKITAGQGNNGILGILPKTSPGEIVIKSHNIYSSIRRLEVGFLKNYSIANNQYNATSVIPWMNEVLNVPNLS